MSEGRLFDWLFGRPENLGQELQGVGLELNELETHVETGGSTRWQPLDPHHFRRVSNRRNVRKEEFHLEKLADLELVVAENANAAEADIDGFSLAGKKLHASGATVHCSP
jgi:hypothetical protein